MAALEKDKEHLLPAALVYIYLAGDALISKSIPPNEDYIANNNNQYINGYFLHDVNTLAELDHSFNSDNISTPYLPLTKLNSGGVKKSHKLLSKEEFNTLIIKDKYLSNLPFIIIKIHVIIAYIVVFADLTENWEINRNGFLIKQTQK